MLKRLHIVAFALAFVLAAWFAALHRQETLRASVPLAQRIVVLDTNAASGRSVDTNAARVPQRARINPQPEELFLRTIDMNIDEDEEFEEVILARKSTDSKVLNLIVAEFAPSSGLYVRFADIPLGHVDAESVIVLAEDVTGDGTVDLVIQGLDLSNQQYLAIVRRDGSRGYGVAFSGSASSLTLLQNAAQDAERAVRIVSEVFLESGQGILRTEFRYNARLRTFEQLTRTLVSVTSIAGHDGPPGTSVEDFQKWLKPFWVKVEAEDYRSLFFDMMNQEIIFSSGAIQQRWMILHTARSGNRLYITCSTSESSDLDRVITIESREKDQILVSIIDQQVSRFRRDEGWSGLYCAEPIPSTKTPEPTSSLTLEDLSGRYLGLEHSVLVMSETKTILVIKGRYYEGISHLHLWNGVQVLEFLALDPNGIPKERMLFAASVSRTPEGKIARLVLEPAKAGPQGISLLRRPPIVLSKTS